MRWADLGWRGSLRELVKGICALADLLKIVESML
jgi:hypothetical protein